MSARTLLCCLGGVLGVGLGMVLAYLVGSLTEWPVVFQPIWFPLGIAVSVLTGLVCNGSGAPIECCGRSGSAMCCKPT